MSYFSLRANFAHKICLNKKIKNNNKKKGSKGVGLPLLQTRYYLQNKAAKKIKR